MGAALQRQRGHLLPFAPVFLALGIGGFFALKWEPGWDTFVGIGTGGLICVWLAHMLRHGVGPVFAGLACVALGFCMAGWRAHWVTTPVLDYRYYGAVEGRVVGVDRSASDKLRLTLDQVRLPRKRPDETPSRVRIALHGQDGVPVPAPGAIVVAAAHLGPSPGPAEPRGFQFQRHTWFQSIGAVGYTRTPVLVFAPPEPGFGLAVFRLRMAMSRALQRAMPGETGAVAAAIVVGDRSAMPLDVVDALRQSNLAHLLAISGLHMGLLTGFVFGLCRVTLALIPAFSLRYSTKKWAAGTALVAAVIYLALSGGAVATERAFVMVAVALGAVIFDRRALTLRSVALAALVVLSLRPEAVLSPGFQMSFAATTALVVVFRQLSERAWMGPKWARPGMSVFVSSFVAGGVTAPLAAAHFNIVSHYGFVANVVSVPLMGSVIMPAAVMAGVLSPIGLESVPLWVMDHGLAWIIGVARHVSDWPGAVGRVPTPPGMVLPMLALGALAMVLWHGRARWVGAPMCLAALIMWTQSHRPPVLIAGTGGLVGVLTDQGRAISSAKGDGFTARVWLENDGDASDQKESFDRLQQPPQINGVMIRALRGKAGAKATCPVGGILVASTQPEAPGDCTVFGPKELQTMGAVALYPHETGYIVETARDQTGARLWNSAKVRSAFRD